jgi:hypothetical protein
MNENTKIERINEHMHELYALFADKWFANYAHLYNNLVGFPLPKKRPGDVVNSGERRESVSSEALENKINYKELGALREYWESFKKSRSTDDGDYAWVNPDSYWTCLKAVFDGVDPSLMADFIKIYAPVGTKDLLITARHLFDQLMARRRTFCMKIAHHHRKDNYSKFDQEVLLRSLRCILHNESTLTSVENSLVPLDPQKFRGW